MSGELVRNQGNTLALTDEHYLSRIPALAQQLARSGMCPESFKGKPDDIAIVGYSLADNGLRLSINTLPQCYVVHGRPGYMAQIQTAMAAMHGVTIRPVGSKCDETSATVEVILPDRSRHEVTFTMKEADAAGLTKPSKSGAPSMYKLWPTNMLVARATTRAIGWYCPAVKLGLAGTVDMEELDVIDAETVDEPDSGETGETGELVSFARAGNMILDAFEAGGHTRDEARPLARQLWQSHGLEPGDSIARSRLDLILALLGALPKNSPAPDQAPDGGDTGGGQLTAPQEPETRNPAPEVVQPEIVYGPGEEPF